MKLGSVICPMKVYDMLRKALKHAMYDADLTGKAVTMGLPPTDSTPVSDVNNGRGSKPAGCFCAPENAAARRTEMNVKKAENTPSLDSVLNVLGSEQSQQTRATMMPKLTVRHATPGSVPVMVLRYSAPTTTCRPWMNCHLSVASLRVPRVTDLLCY